MSWFDWVPQAINIGSSIYSAFNATNANNKATQTVNQAQQTATQQEIAGQTAAQQSYDASKANDTALQTQTAPGVSNQQLAIAQQNTITPAQQVALDEARRTTLNTLQAGDLRGSGRATVAAVINVDGAMTANDLAANRARADAAGSALSSQYFTAGQNINTQNQNIAASQIAAGKAAGTGTIAIGDQSGANTVSNANVANQTVGNVAGTTGSPAGQAINDIGSAISSSIKQRATSSYAQNGQTQPAQI